MTNFSAIPQELRAYNSWVTWRVETTDTGRTTKIPYNPTTFQAAASNRPEEWVSFDTAVTAFNNGGWDGIGFVLSDADPFVFIDLDDPYALNPDGTPKNKEPQKVADMQRTVFERFDGTYSEMSPSGKGLHIIAMAKLAGKGRRRNSVEMYDRERFMTMTGNAYTAAPILERQVATQWLYDEMGGAPVATAFTGDYVDLETDAEVIAKCLNAANGDKVRDLANGNWQQYYSSQSEADFALVNIIAYYTKSRFQIVRLFRQSGLGQREKAQRDAYVLGMVDRAFDRMPSELDLNALTDMLNAEFGEVGAGDGVSAVNVGAIPHAQTRLQSLDGGQVSAPAHSVAAPNDARNPYRRPVPGLLGEIAQYIYAQAPRPVPEIALAGAIGLMAGVVGRAYNTTTGAGLNQYTLLLSGTGRGKEAIQSGISKLMARVVDPLVGGCPAATEFIGPQEFASGQALNKHLATTSTSFVSIIGEVDVTLKNMTAKNANAALLKLRQMYLALYSVSGRGDVMGAVAYSDKEKNSAVVSAPAFSMIGEGTPERFYGLLDEALVSDGLLPRFNVIEYDGPRPPLNESGINTTPSDNLVKRLATLCGHSLMLNQQTRPTVVTTNADANAILRQYNERCDDVINAAHNDVIEQLWNRAHLKVLKLASLVAVGINPFDPVIDANCAQWAIDMVDHSTNKLVAKFNSGDIGEGDNRQQADMARKIKQYYTSVTRDTAMNSYGVTKAAYDARMFNYTYVQRTCVNIASFKNDRMGSTAAVKRTLQTLVDIGAIRKVEDKPTMDKVGLTRDGTAHYIVISSALIDK